MTNEIPLEKQAEELYRISRRVAAKGEPHIGGNEFSGIREGQRYTINHNFWDHDNEWISIYGPYFGVSITFNRGNNPREEKGGYSVLVLHGKMPDNLKEILEGLAPDRERLAEIRAGQIASYRKRNKILGALRDKPFAPFWEKDRLLAELDQREAAFEVKHDPFLPFWIKDKYIS